MLTPSQHDRIARKCASAFTRAIESLPKLLEDADADKAAAIVADLMKAYVCTPSPEADPGADLAEIVRRCAREEEDDQSSSTADFSANAAPDAVPSLPNVPTFEHSNLPTPVPNDQPVPANQILSAPSPSLDW